MPRYSFIDTETGNEFTEFMTLAERKDYLHENPHIRQQLSVPSIGDSVRLGVKKVDRNFNDILVKTKEKHLHSNIKTHY